MKKCKKVQVYSILLNKEITCQQYTPLQKIGEQLIK